MFDVEKIKQIPLTVIALRESNVTLSTRQNSRCPCLNCGEKSTRFTYYTNDNTFKCWFSGVGGTSIDLIKHIRGITDNATAIKYLNDVYLGGGTVEPPPMPTPPIRNSNPAKLDTAVYSYLLAICDGMHDAQIESYLAGRGIGENLRKKYNIGIIAADAVNEVRTELIKKFGVNRLTAAGVLSVNGWFVFSDYRVLLPSMYAGKCLSIHGRATNARVDAPKYKYLTGVSRVPFLLDNLNTAGGRVFIVEGFFDAVSCSQLGNPAIGLGSCNYNKDLYKRLLQQIKKKGLEVVFAYDNDTAGANALKANFDGVPLANYCANIGLRASRWKYSQFTDCKDWNEFYIKHLIKLCDNYATNTAINPTLTENELINQISTAVNVPGEIVKKYFETL